MIHIDWNRKWPMDDDSNATVKSKLWRISVSRGQHGVAWGCDEILSNTFFHSFMVFNCDIIYFGIWSRYLFGKLDVEKMCITRCNIEKRHDFLRPPNREFLSKSERFWIRSDSHIHNGGVFSSIISFSFCSAFVLHNTLAISLLSSYKTLSVELLFVTYNSIRKHENVCILSKLQCCQYFSANH